MDDINVLDVPSALQPYALWLSRTSTSDPEYQKAMSVRISLTGLDVMEILNEFYILKGRIKTVENNRDYLLVHTGRVEL